MSTSDHSIPSTRQLFVLRHAKSNWSDADASDFVRPLNQRGQTAAPLMGTKLRQNNQQVDVILASTAVRVRQTLDLLLPAWQYAGPVIWEKQLYLASPETLTHHLASLDKEWTRVMIVGHNPGLSQLVGQLSGSHVDMPTAAIIQLECAATDWPTAMRERAWAQLAFWKPKEI